MSLSNFFDRYAILLLTFLLLINTVDSQMKIVGFNYPPYHYCNSTGQHGVLYSTLHNTLLDFALAPPAATTYTYECLTDNPATYNFAARTDDYVA
jgi:hypothetical protein